MSNSSRIILRIFTLAACLIFAGAETLLSAQNANSSTMTQEGMAAQNANASNANRGGRRRGGRRRSGNMNAATATETEGGGTVMPTAQAAGTGRCDPMKHEQADLSGTYTGTVDYSEAGLSGEATLTITGNKFTLTSGSTTQEGRISAETTCNYTGATMMFGGEQVTAATGPQPAPLTVISVEAKRMGSGLSLKSVEGERRQFSFNSAPEIRVMRSAPPRTKKRSVPPVGIKPPTERLR